MNFSRRVQGRLKVGLGLEEWVCFESLQTYLLFSGEFYPAFPTSVHCHPSGNPRLHWVILRFSLFYLLASHIVVLTRDRLSAPLAQVAHRVVS